MPTQSSNRDAGCSKSSAMQMATGWDERELFKSAAAIREKYFGNKVQLCMIINAKCGSCDMNCTYCSQSAHNSSDVSTYPLLDDTELKKRIKFVSDSGAHNCGLVTSGGRLTPDDISRVSDVVAGMKNSARVHICASLGRLNESDLEKLKAAGVRRYHHNLETAENFYPQICTTQKWRDRLATIDAARRAGFEVCAGGLFGLGESWEDRVDLAISLHDAGITDVPINFLHAHPGTPLANQPRLSAAEALRIIAVYRHILPTATLRICGGRVTVLGDRQNEIFAAGANAMMVGDYLTTSGAIPENDMKMIKDMGMEIA